MNSVPTEKKDTKRKQGKWTGRLRISKISQNVKSSTRFFNKKGQRRMSFKNPLFLSFRTVSTGKESVQSFQEELPGGMVRSRDYHLTHEAERVEAISIEEDIVMLSVKEDRSPAPKKTVDEVLLEIDNTDVESIELRPDTKEYLQTLHGYLQCFNGLQELYEKVDPQHELSDHEMQDVSELCQQESIEGEIVGSLNELYEVAEEIFPVYVSKIEEMVHEVRNDLMCREDEIKFQLPGDENCDNRLKKMFRASEKARDDYSKKVPGPPESWLYDIVRGSVIFASAAQLLYFLQYLRWDPAIKIIKSKNRFKNPTLSGYRDWNLHIKLTEDTVEHICELQLHLEIIKEADVTYGSHSYYEFFRKFYAGATGTLEERLNDLRAISNGHSLNLAFLKEVIRNPVETDCMLLLADLFQHHVNDYQLAILITNAVRKSDESVNVYKRLGLLFSKQGKPSEALTMYEKHLSSMLETFGPDHQSTAEAYNYIGIISSDQGNLDSAMEMHKRALDIQLEAVGCDDEVVATTQNHIANILWNQGKPVDALAKYNRTLEIRLKTLGIHHLDTIQSYNNIANVLDSQNKWEEALKMYEKVLDMALRVLGKEHPNTASAYSNMAGVLRQQGKLDEAMAMHKLALKIRLETQGQEHTDTAITYNNIANVLFDQGEFNEASQTYQKALDIRLNSLGHNHPDTAQTYNNMAAVLNAQGKKEEALPMYQKYLSISLNTVGEDHPDTALAYSKIAMILGDQGQREEAIRLYRQVLEIHVKNGGMNEESALTCDNLAELLKEEGIYDEAMAIHQQALEIRLSTLGKDHELTAASYSNIAVVLNYQREHEQALRMHQEALDIRLKVLGKYHRDTAESYSLMSDVYYDLGKHDEARKMEEAADEISKRRSRSSGSSSVSSAVRDIKILSS